MSLCTTSYSNHLTNIPGHSGYLKNIDHKKEVEESTKSWLSGKKKVRTIVIGSKNIIPHS